MDTYLILNVCFVVAIALILKLKTVGSIKRSVITFVVLFIFTAIFDSLIVHFGIVEYVSGSNLGFKLAAAPIEDFFYPLLAVILIPFLWTKTGKQ